MRNKLKFAIVGCGAIGKRHAEQIMHFGVLSAVCDILKQKATDFSCAGTIPVYVDIDDMLAKEKEIDVVVVCTPNGLHAKHSIKALQAKKHVLCEKPMAISVADCENMIAAAELNNQRLFIVKQNRFNPPVEAVKSLLDKGALGKIFSLQLNCFWNRDANYYTNSWKGTLQMDGGTLYTQFSHFIDLLYWMFGDVKKILALTENFSHESVTEFEDTSVVAIQFKNGVLGSMHFTVNAFKRNMEGSLTIFAENGTVKIGGQYLNKLEYQSLKGAEIAALPAGSQPNDYGNYQGSMSNHHKVYENVLEVLQENKPMNTLAFEALKTVEIIDRIYKAANIYNSL